MLLLKKALRLGAVVALPLLFLTVTPTEVEAETPACTFTAVSYWGDCFLAWTCDNGDNGFTYTDPEVCNP